MNGNDSFNENDLRCSYILALIGQPYIFAKRGNAIAEYKKMAIYENGFSNRWRNTYRGLKGQRKRNTAGLVLKHREGLLIIRIDLDCGRFQFRQILFSGELDLI